MQWSEVHTIYKPRMYVQIVCENKGTIVDQVSTRRSLKEPGEEKKSEFKGQTKKITSSSLYHALPKWR